MPKKVVERQLRLMRLGEIEAAYDEPVKGEFQYRGDAPWDGVVEWLARIYVHERCDGVIQSDLDEDEADLVDSARSGARVDPGER